MSSKTTENDFKETKRLTERLREELLQRLQGLGFFDDEMDSYKYFKITNVTCSVYGPGFSICFC